MEEDPAVGLLRKAGGELNAAVHEKKEHGVLPRAIPGVRPFGYKRFSAGNVWCRKKQHPLETETQKR